MQRIDLFLKIKSSPDAGFSAEYFYVLAFFSFEDPLRRCRGVKPNFLIISAILAAVRGEEG